MFRSFLSAAAALLPVAFPAVAHAHVGHVGDLAGHSHWAGIAAIAGSAVLAGIVALKAKRKRQAEAGMEDAEAVEADSDTAEAAG
ncbi:hypothetical protein GR183_17105 [Stappia sp. GBMRC 2046]|uniref:LPXTG-motif cell wall anchor domain-containing protein n=1 Tax=Stappia sediminis TaxID=2692190 RepID=A0A7X3LX21_9HYPH|nr:DUF6732 family protein [Stappia sediminis]MXN66638.1 hypothetical protein [Stappia sediminis]